MNLIARARTQQRSASYMSGSPRTRRVLLIVSLLQLDIILNVSSFLLQFAKVNDSSNHRVDQIGPASTNFGRTISLQQKMPNSASKSHLRAMNEGLITSESSLARGDAATIVTAAGKSLAGSFLIERTSDDGKDRFQWSLVPLVDVASVDSAIYPSEGARAWAALHETSPTNLTPNSVVLTAAFTSLNHLEITAHSAPAQDASLVAVLSRILAQWTLTTRQHWQSPAVTTIRFLNEETQIDVNAADLEKLSSPSTIWSDTNSDSFIRTLFAGVDASNSELVEMVDCNGDLLGIVPRKLVHQYNLLHRGIGMFVTKDQPIVVDMRSQHHYQEQPDLYCHRRTATKRIFPSLYDMFVGGVSLAGEEALMTARREVAEELGLTAALEGTVETTGDPCQKLSDRLLRCVVCTEYNRCVVDLFCYTMDTSTERVTWQEEEVAWGSFVPYSIVEAAADLSIMRLADAATATNGWPGRHPPIQSPRQGDAPAAGAAIANALQNWTTWDFVPDGLLVWEAWLRLIQKSEIALTQH